MTDILKRFIEHDIVSLKQVNGNNTEETPLFTIARIDKDKVYLHDIETAYSTADLVAVALTDCTIKNIDCSITYMASVIEADETGPCPQNGKRLNIRIKDKDIESLIKKHSIKYVHELQHVLTEKLIVTSIFRHNRILQQSQTVNK